MIISLRCKKNPLTLGAQVLQTWPAEQVAVSPHETVAVPPPWLLPGYDGTISNKKWGGLRGWWGSRTPPITHFVGSPDKENSMRALGWWYPDVDPLATVVSRAVAAAPPEAPSVVWPEVRFCSRCPQRWRLCPEQSRDAPSVVWPEVRFGSRCVKRWRLCPEQSRARRSCGLRCGSAPSAGRLCLYTVCYAGELRAFSQRKDRITKHRNTLQAR